MGTVMVFSGGHSVEVLGTNAESLIQNLGRAAQGQVKVPGSTYPLAEGWVDVQTKDGVILVNPGQVAYVRDMPDPQPVFDQA